MTDPMHPADCSAISSPANLDATSAAAPTVPTAEVHDGAADGRSRSEAGGDGREAASLGNDANSSSTAAQEQCERRAARYRLRSKLAKVTRLERVKHCGRVPVVGGGIALVCSEGAPGERVAGWRGLASCGSVWACPRCAAVIGQRRAAELREALERWESWDSGCAAILLTLTVRHHAGQSLREVWDGLSRAWGRLTSGRPWRRWCEQVGVVGFVRVAEVTYGHAGWHVHLHVVLVAWSSRGAWYSEGTAEHFAEDLFVAWERVAAGQGVEAVPEVQDVRPVTLADADRIGRYLAKHGDLPEWDAADEVARGSVKRGRAGNRTPMQVLADALETGDMADLAIWWEWEAGSYGRHQQTWSRGLRAHLWLDDERSDDDLAGEVVDGAEGITDGEIVASLDRGDAAVLVLTGDEWRAIRDTSAVTDLLELAERVTGEVGLAVRAVLVGVLARFRSDSRSRVEARPTRSQKW